MAKGFSSRGAQKENGEINGVSAWRVGWWGLGGMRGSRRMRRCWRCWGGGEAADPPPQLEKTCNAEGVCCVSLGRIAASNQQFHPKAGCVPLEPGCSQPRCETPPSQGSLLHPAKPQISLNHIPPSTSLFFPLLRAHVLRKYKNFPCSPCTLNSGEWK